MKTIVPVLAGLVLVTAAPAARAAGPQEPEIAKTFLKVGDTAPDFTLLSDEWKPVSLSEYRGKKNVILAFYVLAFTGG